MIAIAVVLAAKAVRRAREILGSVESVNMAAVQEPNSGTRTQIGRLRRIASKVGTAFA